jgi:co-chaperonin GroES (HSP10)
VKATNDRLIIQKGYVLERTQGGIILSSGTSADAKVKLNIGKVLSAGSGIKFASGDVVIPACEVGDVVMWEQFGEIMAEVLGDGIVAVRWEDVMAILEPEEYKNWIFDKVEYDRQQDAFQKELEIRRKELQKSEEKMLSETKVYRCEVPKCGHRSTIRKRVGESLACEYCGVEMEEVKDKKVAGIIVPGGASPSRL